MNKIDLIELNLEKIRYNHHLKQKKPDDSYISMLKERKSEKLVERMKHYINEVKNEI